MTTVTRYSDPRRDSYFLTGLIAANFGLYAAIAKAARGDLPTLRLELSKKTFEGTLDGNGTLSYCGLSANWRDLV